MFLLSTRGAVRLSQNRKKPPFATPSAADAALLGRGFEPFGQQL